MSDSDLLGAARDGNAFSRATIADALSERAATSALGAVPGSTLRSGPSLRGASIWNLIGKLAVAVCALVATPFILRLLGPASYGFWAMMLSLMSYLSLADVGMGQASTRIAGLYSKGQDMDAEAGVVRAAVLTVGVTMLPLVLWLIVFARPITSLLISDPSLQSDATVAFRFLSVAGALQILANTLNTALVLRLDWKPLTFATAGVQCVQLALCPLVLWLRGPTLTGLAVIYAVGSAATVAILVFLSGRRNARFLARRLGFREHLRPLLRFGLPLAASSVAALPLTSADRIFVSHADSPETLSQYSAALTSVAFATTLGLAVAQPLYTRMLDAYRELGPQALAHACRTWSLRFLVGSIALSSVAVMLSRAFFRIWAGANYGTAADLFRIIIWGAAANVIAFIPYCGLLALNRSKVIAKLHFIELAPYLIAIYVCGREFGVWGVAWVWTARLVADGVILQCILRGRLRTAREMGPETQTNTATSVP